MKKAFIITVLFFCISGQAQEVQSHNNTQGEMNMESNAGKAFQGAFVSAFTYFTFQQFARDTKAEWLKIPLSVLTSYVAEVALNKQTNTEKQLFVVAGAVTVTFTCEIFKGKNRRR